MDYQIPNIDEMRKITEISMKKVEAKEVAKAEKYINRLVKRLSKNIKHEASKGNHRTNFVIWSDKCPLEKSDLEDYLTKIFKPAGYKVEDVYEYYFDDKISIDIRW